MSGAPDGSGDTVDEAVVTAPRMYADRYDSMYGGSSGGGGGSGGSGATLGMRAATYASQHITADLGLSDAHNLAWYQQVHQALASLYMKSMLNPASVIDGPGTRDMTGSQVVQSLMNISVVLTSQPVAFDAHSQPNSAYTS